MCITFFCLQPTSNKEIKLILGFNREEQTQRSTLRLQPFAEDKNIYGGKDLISGGTWLGLNIQTGVFVFLTNYDLQIYRLGLSRGKLVHSFLKTQFIPIARKAQTDSIIYQQLRKIAKMSQQYSPFNLTVCNLRSRRAYYVCSQRNPGFNIPQELSQGQTIGICNSDIKTVWPKTALGKALFSQLVSHLGQLKEPQIFTEMNKIFKNKERFSQVDDDQSRIFVQPYFCKAQQAERRTKTTFNLMLLEKEEKYEIILKQITYSGQQMEETELQYRLEMTK